MTGTVQQPHAAFHCRGQSIVGMLVTATLVMASIVGYSQVAKQLIQEVRLAAVAYRAKIQTYVNAANDGE